MRKRFDSDSFVLAASILASAMGFIDSTAVNVILPILQRELHADAQSVQWVVEGYALFLSALILVGGALGDVYGRRRLFMVGVAIFAGASVGCALAQSIMQLIVARCVQGIGAALLVPESLALISAEFSPERRGKAIGTWAAFSAISGAVGPILGGVIAQHFSWRWVFLLNAPIAGVVLLIAWRKIRESRDEGAGKHIDFGGAALATIGLAGLIYALIDLQGIPPDNFALPVAGFSIGVLGAFIVYELRVKAPMLPLKFFRSADFSGANAYTFLLYSGLGGSLFFVPFNVINVQGYTPTEAGATLLPTTLLIFGLSRLSGAMQTRIGARPMLVAGALIAAAGFALFAMTGQGRSYWISFFPASMVLGLGAAMFVTPLTATVMNSLETAHAGVASGVNNAIARTAGLIAVAALGLVLSVVFYRTYDRGIQRVQISPPARAAVARDRARLFTGYVPKLPPKDDRAVRSIVHASFVRGFAWTMASSAALAFGGSLIALFTIGRSSKRAQSPN